MKFVFPILLLMLAFPSLHAQPGVTDTIYPGRDLTPLLPNIFFDKGSATIPDRYVQFQSRQETESFNDTTLSGDALAFHRQILNIIGYRLRKNPATRITIGGHDSRQPDLGETKPVAEQRARTVRDYLVNIWQIDTSRIAMLPSGGWPKFPSNKLDSVLIVENRRTEIRSFDWEINRPIVRTRTGANVACPMIDHYWLIGFLFDSPEMGELNERIVRENLFPAINSLAVIQVTGYLDRNVLSTFKKISKDRAARVVKAIRRNVNSERYSSIQGDGVGTTQHPFPLDTPEGHFYSRGVSIVVTRWMPAPACIENK